MVVSVRVILIFALSAEMVLKEPNSFTVVELRNILQQRNLAMQGSKADLISRLFEADPERNWRNIDEGSQFETKVVVMLMNTQLHCSVS